jgi:hypothetical protein
MLSGVIRSYGKGNTTRNGCVPVPVASQVLDARHFQPKRTILPELRRGLIMGTWHTRAIGKGSTGSGIIGPEGYAGLPRLSSPNHHVLPVWSGSVLVLSSPQTRHMGLGHGPQKPLHVVQQAFLS